MPKETVPSGPRWEGFSNESFCRNRTGTPGLRRTPLVVMQSTMVYDTGIGRKNHGEVSQDHSRLFCNWSFRELNRRPPTLQVEGNHQILPRRPHYKLSSASFFVWELESTNADAWNSTFPQQPPNYSSELDCRTLALQGTLQPHLDTRTNLPWKW